MHVCVCVCVYFLFVKDNAGFLLLVIHAPLLVAVTKSSIR